MKIAVLDDEVNHLEVTSKMIKQYMTVEDSIYCFEAIEEFEKFFNTNPLIIDIVVLDICLPESNGIEVAKRIRAVNSRCRIIYLSNYLEFATEVYETDHTFFVLKTQAKEKLPVAFERAKTQLENIRKESVCVKKLHEKRVVIFLNDILYAERIKRKTIIYTVDDVVETLENPEDIFADFIGKGMVKCHRSFWINPAHILNISKSEVVLTAEKKIAVSRSYSDELRRSFMNYVTSGE